jgi:alpha-1,3-rhamnosyltransferase
MHRDNTQPLVSIIIPCYNYEKYVEQSIKSALEQTYENIEVIVVDNGSTDGSLLKIKKFLSEKNVKVLQFKNNNPPGKYNSFHMIDAVRESKGEYISMLYADDWYLPSKIEKQMDIFKKSPSSVGVVYCHGYCYYEKNKEKFKWKHQAVRGYVFKDYMRLGDIVMPISPLVKRHCYNIIGVDNPWTGTEYDYLVMSQYVDFDFVDDYLAVMRQHENNDAKNVASVYLRVKKFHNIVLLSDGAIQRAGRFLINKRIARDYLTFGLDFITRLEMKYGKDAIFSTLRASPIFIFKPRLLACLILIFLPVFVSKYLLQKIKKLSPTPMNTCEW